MEYSIGVLLEKLGYLKSELEGFINLFGDIAELEHIRVKIRDLQRAISILKEGNGS